MVLLSRQVHIKNVKTDFSLEISLKTLWRVLVPFTPLSSAVSHRRRQEICLATWVTREQKVCSEVEVEIKISFAQSLKWSLRYQSLVSGYGLYCFSQYPQQIQGLIDSMQGHQYLGQTLAYDTVE